MGTTAHNVTQVVYPVVKELKSELLSFLIGSRNYSRVLVFVRKKQEAERKKEEKEYQEKLKREGRYIKTKVNLDEYLKKKSKKRNKANNNSIS